ncbi:RDD family protein [Chitiniphilus eburneus]|uniref:RDD family protein n=1 Tax=Chitiniphilus eburneus TaxID=2571148 RepID=A0A4U0QCG4_9NEIS|nr:RDD family protein [Chitiniphilus eburneus]TJZ79099.1 RDD family protein [Chitiniphilus eburneus]
MNAETVVAVETNPYAATTVDLQQNASDDLELAGRGTRLGAVLLDGLFGTIAGIPLIAAAIATPAMFQAGVSPGAGLMVGIVIGSLLLLAFVIYNFVLVHRNGQTLGKKVLGIKIVRQDGSRCGLRRYVFIRYLPIALLSMIPLVGVIVSLLDPLLIFRESRHCLHDDIAGTIVVRA